MVGVVLFTLSVVWCGIQFGFTADQLEFWERDPKFDARRSWITNPKQRNGRYGKLKMDPQIQKFNTAESNSLEVKASNKEKKQGFFKKFTDAVDKPTKQALRKGKEASDDGLSNYQKPIKHRFTRMTPMYLKQQHGKYTSNHSKQTTEDDKIEKNLNPYNLRQQLEEIVSEYAGSNVTIEILARTAAYNDIVLLKVTDSNNKANKYFRADDSKYIDEVPEKKIIFIVHGLSVRGINNALPCLQELKQFRKLLEIYFAHLDNFDIFLIPMANPDGLKSDILLWDKNMSPQSACHGVALDRNFDIAWNATATVSSCSQQYPGASPFSEPETKAIREVFHKYSHKIVGYFHVHAGTYNYDSFKGDAVLYPKGYSDVQTDDDKYIDLRGEIEEALKNASFQIISVTVDTLYNWYGKVAGTSVDYASTIYGIPYAMELVMQPYKDDGLGVDAEDKLSLVALSEIWKRVIDVIFNNISKNINFNEV